MVIVSCQALQATQRPLLYVGYAVWASSAQDLPSLQEVSSAPHQDVLHLILSSIKFLLWQLSSLGRRNLVSSFMKGKNMYLTGLRE